MVATAWFPGEDGTGIILWRPLALGLNFLPDLLRLLVLGHLHVLLLLLLDGLLGLGNSPLGLGLV